MQQPQPSSWQWTVTPTTFVTLQWNVSIMTAKTVHSNAGLCVPQYTFCHWASYISTNSLPVNRRRYQSSRPCAWYVVSRGFPQMNITSKPATIIFAPPLPVYRALSTPFNTDTNQTTFCNVNATSGQSCSWNANRCSSCHILNTGKLLHKTLCYFCFMLHRTLLRNVNGHGEQGSSNSSSINPVQKHDTQNNVSRPPANTILDMAKKNI